MTPLFCSSCKILSDLVGEGFSNLDLNLRDERKEQRVCCGGGVIGHPLIIIINLLTKRHRSVDRQRRRPRLSNHARHVLPTRGCVIMMRMVSAWKVESQYYDDDDDDNDNKVGDNNDNWSSLWWPWCWSRWRLTMVMMMGGHTFPIMQHMAGSRQGEGEVGETQHIYLQARTKKVFNLQLLQNMVQASKMKQKHISNIWRPWSSFGGSALLWLHRSLSQNNQLSKQTESSSLLRYCNRIKKIFK